MINLLNKKFIKSITCDKPQRANFELENLIEDKNSNNGDFDFYTSSLMKKNFSADTFVRAPVNVQIVFNQSVHIEAVYLESKVNSQISNGFVLSSSFKQSRDGSYMYQEIAKVTNDSNKTVCSYEFKKRNSTYGLSCDTNEPSNIKEKMLIYFKGCPNAYLDKAIALKISIIRTLNSTSPCLSLLKVYGYSSDPSNTNILDNKSAEIFNSEKANSCSKSVEVPNEFFDEITHEVMRMPIKLPSEKYVDKSTLDHYLLEQSKCNTQAKDPFTRVTFNSSYKPIIDEALKASIDKFVLDNAITFSSKRTKSEITSSSLMKTEEERARSNKRSHIDTLIYDKSDLALNFDKELCKKSRREPSRASDLACNCCLNSKNDKLTFYEITTCKHTYCKNCLLSFNKVCPLCKKTFNYSQVINFDRYFLNKS
jgi:hypothetical protein